MKQITSLLLSVILACSACYNGMSQTYDTSDKQERTSNLIRFYGGIGLWGIYSYGTNQSGTDNGAVGYIRHYPTAVYGFSYQRDLVRRFSLELDIQSSYRNGFPDFADAYVYSDAVGNSITGIGDIPEVKDYLQEQAAQGSNLNNLAWIRHNSLAITVKPVFHMIDNEHHRFSVYAGIGYYFADGLCFRAEQMFPTVTPMDFTTFTSQYHINGLAGNAGLRYEYTFLTHYVIGIDAGATFNDNAAGWQREDASMLSSCDFRTVLYIGFRF